MTFLRRRSILGFLDSWCGRDPWIAVPTWRDPVKKFRPLTISMKQLTLELQILYTGRLYEVDQTAQNSPIPMTGTWRSLLLFAVDVSPWAPPGRVKGVTWPPWVSTWNFSHIITVAPRVEIQMQLLFSCRLYELKLLSVFDSMILMNVVSVCYRYFVYILQVIVVLNYTKYQI